MLEVVGLCLMPPGLPNQLARFPVAESLLWPGEKKQVVCKRTQRPGETFLLDRVLFR